MPITLLCLGLGNPGSEYAATRHNVGFRVIDALADHRDCPLRRSLRAHAMTGRCRIQDHTLLLAQPLTYMNASGQSYTALVHQHHPQETLICSDDLDLPLGALRLTRGGSSGGHRGVQSIIDSGGTDTLRLRMGIGTNRTPDGHRIPAEDFVLQHFSPTEAPLITEAITRARNTILLLLQDGLPAAQQYAHTPHHPT